MPDGMENFWSLSEDEQYARIEQERQKCERDGRIFWHYLQESTNSRHACKFLEMFTLDPGSDSMRYNFLNDIF